MACIHTSLVVRFGSFFRQSSGPVVRQSVYDVSRGNVMGSLPRKLETLDSGVDA